MMEGPGGMYGSEEGTTTVANPYHYVSNDPLNFVDPLGLCRMTDVEFTFTEGYDEDAEVTDGPGGGYNLDQCRGAGNVRCSEPEQIHGTEEEGFLTTGEARVWCRPDTGGPLTGVDPRDLLEIAGIVLDGVDLALCGVDVGTGDWENAQWDCLAIIPIAGNAARIPQWADEVAQIPGRACSFTSDTEVVMADGSRKKISDVEIGDQVLATDPETDETVAREVTAVFAHEDIVVDLIVDGGGTVTTTEDHPFWNETDGEWRQAEDLDEDDELRTADGDTITVEGIDDGTERTDTAYNLTVDQTHTFYVTVGDDEALVHNTCLSPNQINQAIRRGQAPRGLVRVDTPRVPHEQVHMTFDNGAALNIDGTWKHGSYNITRAQREYLEENGWVVP
jgi:hypothetical protein